MRTVSLNLGYLFRRSRYQDFTIHSKLNPRPIGLSSALYFYFASQYQSNKVLSVNYNQESRVSRVSLGTLYADKKISVLSLNTNRERRRELLLLYSSAAPIQNPQILQPRLRQFPIYQLLYLLRPIYQVPLYLIISYEPIRPLSAPIALRYGEKDFRSYILNLYLVMLSSQSKLLPTLATSVSQKNITRKLRRYQISYGFRDTKTTQG